MHGLSKESGSQYMFLHMQNDNLKTYFIHRFLSVTLCVLSLTQISCLVILCS